MKNFLIACFMGILCSLYIFPFEFHAFPGVNTKMILALFGLVLFGFDLIGKRSPEVGKDMLGVTIFALVFSLLSYFSVVYNNTTDMAYATYFISMWVWTGGAYFLIYVLRRVHSQASIQLIFHYFALVCVAQLFIALVIDANPAVQELVDSVISQNEEFLHETNRLYGIGASFDTAGIRFSCALIGLGYLITHKPSAFWLWSYWLCFIIIVVVGNMMARTTIVGVLLSVLYMGCYKITPKAYLSTRQLKRFLIWTALLVTAIVFIVAKYKSSPDFHHDIRYAFEGFFNYIETGEWETSSTNRLMSMVVWPDNMKTWLIGDGLFDNPYGSGFYMHTDVGYLRLIFYCGLIGLFSFIVMLLFIVYRLSVKWPKESLMVVFLFILQSLVWIKISTDIYQIFALLLLLKPAENQFRKIIFYKHDTEEDSLLLVE